MTTPWPYISSESIAGNHSSGCEDTEFFPYHLTELRLFTPPFSVIVFAHVPEGDPRLEEGL